MNAYNSFKTMDYCCYGVPLKTVVKPIVFNPEEYFPELVAAKSESGDCTTLNYKGAAEKLVVKTLIDTSDYVKPGWVRYTIDKKTKTMEERHGEVIDLVPVMNHDEKEEHIFNEMINALNKNWEKNRKTFIKCHGEDYYNSQFLMEHYEPYDFGEDTIS